MRFPSRTAKSYGYRLGKSWIAKPPVRHELQNPESLERLDEFDRQVSSADYLQEVHQHLWGVASANRHRSEDSQALDLPPIKPAATSCGTGDGHDRDRRSPDDCRSVWPASQPGHELASTAETLAEDRRGKN